MKRGCDISAVQGLVSDADIEGLKAQGVEFMIHRFLVGNEAGIDARVKANIARFQAHGIACGPYGFIFPLPHIDPVVWMQHFVATLQAMGNLGLTTGTMTPMIDAEWPVREEWKKLPDGSKVLTYPWAKWGCSATQIREWILATMAEAKRLTGLAFPLYSFRYWLECIEAQKALELAEYPLALADYTYAGRWPTEAECDRLKPPAPWKRITILQHDGNGGLKLASGVDADFDVFLGSDQAFADMLHAAPVDPTPLLPDPLPPFPHGDLDIDTELPTPDE